MSWWKARTLLLGSLCLLAPVAAQGQAAALQYELAAGSEFASGCTGPSPCLCPVFVFGEVTGTFRLQLLLPPIGPVFDFEVQEVSWVVTPEGEDPFLVTGSGLYMVDLITGIHRLTLDLVVDGAPQAFESMGFVPGGENFPENLGIGVFHQVNACIYDGFVLAATLISSPFQRGDCNVDGSYDVADPIFLLTELFDPGPLELACADACDANDDGVLNIADPIYVLSDLFGAGAEPPDPFVACGEDPTPDEEGCSDFPLCP